MIQQNSFACTKVGATMWGVSLRMHLHLLQILVSDDEYLHILSADRKCRHGVTLGETSLVSLLSHDLVPSAPGMEILVATVDGTLVCLGRKQGSESAETEHLDEHRYHALYSLASETRSYNDFSLDGRVHIILS